MARTPSTRPHRPRVLNELGKPQTLMTGPGQFERMGGVPGNDVLLLGVGPQPLDPVIAAGLNMSGANVLYVECPDFASQMDDAWREAIPKQWTRISPGEVDRELALRCEVFRYMQGVRLFPSFWGPVVAACRWAYMSPSAPMERSRSVLVAADMGDLLAREVVAALQELGLAPKRMSPELMDKDLPTALIRSRPQCFFSVNFKGLDAYGERYELLRAAGVPVAVWCVDNPWHLLSGLKSPFWKQAHLFVTDDSFIEPLKGHSAEHVEHLPLAVSPDFFGPESTDATVSGGSPFRIPLPPQAQNLGELVFVGRSTFPNRRQFFAGCAVDDEDMEAARALLELGGRPDHAWWTDRLGAALLWPSAQARRPGYGAEEMSRMRRAACLNAAARELSVTIFGDEGWRDMAPQVRDLRPPVDYYGPLSAIYRAAPYTLNVTSLLLPRGLTQRHFDVWGAGGFLLTDATPGLSIFPRDLVEAISFRTPSEIPALLRRLESDPTLAVDLRRAWRSLILSEHTYVHRMTTVLVALGL